MADLVICKFKGVVFSIFAWIALCSAALYPEDGPVIVMDEETYRKEVIEGANVIWMLEYFQEDCAGCLQVSPEYTKAANSLKGIVKVAAVDCKLTPMICGHMGIKTLPAIKLFPWEKKKNPYTGSFYKESPATFEGPMPFTSKQLVEFAHGALPSRFVEIVSSDNGTAEAFLSDKSLAPPVLLLSNKGTVTAMFKSLSLQFRGRLRFAQAASSDATLVTLTGATAFPSLFVRKDDQFVKYEGALKAEPIAEFLKEHALEKPEAGAEEVEEGGKGAEEGKAEGRAAEKKDEGKVPALKGEDFEKVVLQSEELWLVAFINDVEECAEKRKAWESALVSVRGMTEIAELETNSDPEALKLAERYGVKSQVEDLSKCLAVLLFEFGDEKPDSEPQVYGGDLGGKALSSFLFDGLPDMFVHRLTMSSFQSFTTAEFMKPKMVLMTQKTEVPGMYKALATRFRREALFAIVHESEKDVLSQFKAETLPQISVIMALPSQTSPGQYDATVQNYRGPLKFNSIAYFLFQVLQATGVKRMAEIPEVTDDAAFQETCVSRGRLCAIGFFRADSSALAEHKDVLRQLSAEMGGEGGAYSFLWVDANKNIAFARQFEILKGQTPTVAIISPAKLRAAVLRESYTKASVSSFLSNLLSGRVPTTPITQLPSFVGGSAIPEEPEPEEVAPVEEEFNLDDIMGEEIEDAGALGSKERRLEEVERELREAEEAKKKAEEEAAAQAAKKTKKKKKKSKKAKKDEL